MNGKKWFVIITACFLFLALITGTLAYVHSPKLVERQKQKMLDGFDRHQTALGDLVTYIKQNDLVLEESREDGYVLSGGDYVWLPEISPLIAELYADFSARDIAWETVDGTVSMSICRYHSINRVEISLVYSETELSGEYGHTLISDNWYLRVWALT